MFLLKPISKGFDISMLSILNDSALTLIVEKKNIFNDRSINKIYKIFELTFLYLNIMLYNNE